jgi:hypothetical protein
MERSPDSTDLTGQILLLLLLSTPLVAAGILEIGVSGTAAKSEENTLLFLSLKINLRILFMK